MINNNPSTRLMFQYKILLNKAINNHDKTESIALDAIRYFLIAVYSCKGKQHDIIGKVCKNFWLIKEDKDGKLYIPKENINQDHFNGDIYIDNAILRMSLDISISQLENYVTGNKLDYDCYWRD